ncbi:MAG: SRPBCC family protein [Anaerolineales bacterium]
MSKIEGSVTIDRPIEEVFDYMHNPENDPKWQPEVIETIAEGPPAVGSTLTMRRKVMGREIEAVAEVTEYKPPHKSSVKSQTGPVQFQSSYIFEETEGGTRVRFEGDVEPGGILKVASGALASQIEKDFSANLKRLKNILEGAS